MSVCACPPCDVAFTPVRATHIYCCRSCRDRAWGRRYRATAEGQAKTRARRYRYDHSAHGRAMRHAKQQQYRHTAAGKASHAASYARWRTSPRGHVIHNANARRYYQQQRERRLWAAAFMFTSAVPNEWSPS